MKMNEITLQGNPTDAHKGLPYYMTPLRAPHAMYSRVAPCGRPLDSCVFLQLSTSFDAFLSIPSNMA